MHGVLRGRISAGHLSWWALVLFIHGKVQTWTTFYCYAPCAISVFSPTNIEWMCVIVTGPLSELQIAYVCRETLQVIYLEYFEETLQSLWFQMWSLRNAVPSFYRVWDISTLRGRCTAISRYNWFLFHFLWMWILSPYRGCCNTSHTNTDRLMIL